MKTLLQRLLILPILFFSNLTIAQIPITMEDMLNLIGTSSVSKGIDSTSFNIGSPGGNQMWDFRNISVTDSFSTSREFITPQQTPYYNMYPKANLASHIKIDFLGFKVSESINYNNVTSSYIENIGSVSTSAFSLDTAFIFMQDTVSPLPLTYGSTWFKTETDTIGFPPTILTDSTTHNIDAYGTIKLPIGDFEVLRIRRDSKIITKPFFGSPDTNTYISYDWISSRTFILASIISQPNETNPNFTTGSFYRADEINTSVSVKESILVPEKYQLYQNFPNPFNPATTIGFSISYIEFVTLKVYDLLGREVATLVDENKPAGSYEVEFDASSLSSGTYFYRLQAGEYIETKKFILMK